MTTLLLDYAASSEIKVQDQRADLGLVTNRRRPVCFHGKVRDHVISFRLAMQALGELVWSDDTWLSDADYWAPILDPIITVHPDRIFFEAFSQDQSVYGVVIADRNLFEVDEEVICGTTNVDFTSWLWKALGEMRSNRETWLNIGPKGFSVRTEGGKGRFEKKVEIPDSWVRGFLQLQGAMAMPGTRIQVRPVDLLSAIRFLQHNKAKTSPRGMRYEFEPDQPVRLILEPWNQIIPLKGTTHNYPKLRTIRVWGRRRLNLLERLLAHAEGLTIYLKGRALPTFYSVQLPGLTFVMGLSGWTGNRWTNTGGLASLGDDEAVDSETLALALGHLRKEYHLKESELAKRFELTQPVATSTLMRLCRQGRAVYDVERREFRHREMFETPIDEAHYFPPDPRRMQAKAFVRKQQVQITSCQREELKKVHSRQNRFTGEEEKKEVTYLNWRVQGNVADQTAEVVVQNNGRISFGTCTCSFFKEFMLTQGPCEHIQALYFASEDQRPEAPVLPPKISRTVPRSN